MTYDFEEMQAALGIVEKRVILFGFEGTMGRWQSRRKRKWPVGQVVKTEASHAFNIGSNPVRVTIKFEECLRKRHAPLAQLVEQLTLNQWVPGSNP